MKFTRIFLQVFTVYEISIVGASILFPALLGVHLFSALAGLGGKNVPQRASYETGVYPAQCRRYCSKKYPLRLQVLKLCKFCRCGHDIGVRPLRCGFDNSTQQVMYKIQYDNPLCVPKGGSRANQAVFHTAALGRRCGCYYCLRNYWLTKPPTFKTYNELETHSLMTNEVEPIGANSQPTTPCDCLRCQNYLNSANSKNDMNSFPPTNAQNNVNSVPPVSTQNDVNSVLPVSAQSDVNSVPLVSTQNDPLIDFTNEQTQINLTPSEIESTCKPETVSRKSNSYLDDLAELMLPEPLIPVVTSEQQNNTPNMDPTKSTTANFNKQSNPGGNKIPSAEPEHSNTCICTDCLLGKIQVPPSGANSFKTWTPKNPTLGPTKLPYTNKPPWGMFGAAN